MSNPEEPLNNQMHSKPRILICGDTGISVEFGDKIDPGINAIVRRLYTLLKSGNYPGITDLNPTYRSLLFNMIHGYAHMSGLPGSLRSISRHFLRTPMRLPRSRKFRCATGAGSGRTWKRLPPFMASASRMSFACTARLFTGSI